MTDPVVPQDTPDQPVAHRPHPTKIGRIVRIVLINLGLTIALVLALNIICTALVIAQKARYAGKGASDSRIALPAVTDKERARTFFTEFYRLRVRYVPYAEWRYEPFVGHAVNIGDDGLRRTLAPVAAGGRIHFFGGSTMWGTAAWDGETIPAFVAQQMQVAAVNHGQSGFVSRQELNELLNLLNSDQQTDGVVFYDGVNDVYVLCTVASSVNGHGQEAQMQDAMRRQVDRSWNIFQDMFFGGTLQFVQLLNERFSVAPRSGSCAGDPQRAQRVADTLWGNWQSARALLAARGIPFLAVLQPVSGVGRPNIGYLTNLELQATEYQAVYPLLQAKMASEESWTLDLSEALNGDTPLFIDWSHVVPKGNEIIAQRLSDRLGRMIRRPAASSPAPQ